MMIKLLLGKILCLFKYHNWKLAGYDFKKTIRLETCIRCKKAQNVYDLVGVKYVRDLRAMAWQERRRVIVEKHKNIKDYVLSIKYPHANNELVRVLEFQSSDAKYESLKDSLMKTCIDNQITEDRVSIKCLNVKNEEIPDMFLL